MSLLRLAINEIVSALNAYFNQMIRRNDFDCRLEKAGRR
jgi:hypothetical protein